MAANGKVKFVNPNKNLQIPNWINEAYFAEILRKDEPDHVKVLKFTSVAATPPGENFTSIMVRVHMTLGFKDGSTKLKSYILKTTLDLDKGGNIAEDLNFFPKEIQMYQKFIPEFEAFYKEAGRDVQLAPKCLFTESTKERISIVFEDLREKGFGNIDRLLGFDMKHMRHMLQKLAELHAASVAWVERHGPFPEEYQIGFMKKNAEDRVREQYKDMFNSKLDSYKKAMALWGLEGAEKYIEKFPTFEQFWSCMLSSLETDPDDFNVLNHGDFWSSNIMLTYLPNGDINQILVLDYQLCKWGSPAQDLLFFITISAAKDIRIKEFDHFVEIYHEHLVDCLKLLKYKKPLPSLRHLHMALYKEPNTFYAFFAVYNHLVVVLLPTDKDSNLNTLHRGDEFGNQFRMRAFTNPLYKEAMLDLYPFFHRRGLFNFGDYVPYCE